MEDTNQHETDGEIDRAGIALNRKKNDIMRQWVHSLSALTESNSRVKHEDVQDLAARIRESAISGTLECMANIL